MCRLALRGWTRERIKFGIGRFVDIEARDMGGDLVLLAFVGGHNEVEEVPTLSQMRWRRVPRRQGDLLYCLGSRLGGRRDQLSERRHSLEVVVLDR